MTCIVGFIDKNKNIYLGGDSAGVDGLDVIIRKDSKVFRNKDMVMGYTSSFRMGQLLRFKLKIPLQPTYMDDYEYMCTAFIDSVRKCLKDNGYSKIKENEESIGTFIVGYKGELYTVSDDLQVGVSENNYSACGCGTNYALGSLATCQHLTAEQTVRRALEIAEKFSGGVRRPFHIVVLKKENEK